MSALSLRASGRIAVRHFPVALHFFAVALLFFALALCSDARAEPGDALRGERVYQRCYSCHSVDPDETAKLQGPSLFEIIGRPAGTGAGFKYSEALKSRGAAGLVWSADAIDQFIANPDSFIPETKMNMPPLRDAQERADLLAYLKRPGSHQSAR